MKVALHGVLLIYVYFARYQLNWNQLLTWAALSWLKPYSNFIAMFSVYQAEFAPTIFESLCETEQQAMLSDTVIQRCTETTPWIWNRILVSNSMRPVVAFGESHWYSSFAFSLVAKLQWPQVSFSHCCWKHGDVSRRPSVRIRLGGIPIFIHKERNCLIWDQTHGFPFQAHTH